MLYLSCFKTLWLSFNNLRLFQQDEKTYYFSLQNLILKFFFPYSGFYLYYKQFLFYILSTIKSVINNYSYWVINRSYHSLLFFYITNNYVQYKISFQPYGLGNRLIELSSSKLVLQLGYAHSIAIFKYKNMKFTEHKRKRKNTFTIISNNFNAFKNFIYLLKHLKVPDPYNANGMRILKEQYKLRPRKKWGVI